MVELCLVLVTGAILAGCSGNGTTVSGNPPGNNAGGGGGGGTSACGGTVVAVPVVLNPQDDTQGFALEITDAVDTNADTAAVDAVDPGGDVTGAATVVNDTVNSITVNVNVTDTEVLTIVINSAVGSLAQGDSIPVTNGAPPPGATKFATVVLSQEGQGIRQWMGSGGTLELTSFVAPTEALAGTLTLTLSGVCFEAQEASGATGTFTMNGQTLSSVQFVGPPN